MLEVQKLSKSYGKSLAVDEVSFFVPDGTVGILLGPNGAGKSTIIKSIAGLLRYQGRIGIQGLPARSVEAKRQFAYVPEMPAMFDALSVREHIEYMRKAYNSGITDEEVEALLARFDLDDKQDKLGNELSKGMMQKVSICCALAIRPKVLLLDEPTAGMDALSRRQMWNLLRKLNGKNLTILLTTHYMEEAQNLCSRVALMDHGKLEEVNTPAGLIDSLGNYTVDEFAGDETHSHYFHSREEAIAYLSGLSGQASLRETTLEDVFVERAGRHLMPS